MIKKAMGYFLDVVILSVIATWIGAAVSSLLPSLDLSLSFQGAVITVGFIMLIEELFDNEVD